MQERKAFPVAQLKALDSEEDKGLFEAIVSVYGNVDHYGDRMIAGAFDRSVKELGFPAVVWSHMWSVVPIGATLEIGDSSFEKDGKKLTGLRVLGQLLVDDHEVARQAYAAMKVVGGDGRPPLRQFSFAYDIVESRSVTEDGDDVRELVDVDLYEVGPTLLGANPETQLLGVKDLAAALTQSQPPDANQEPKSTEVDEEAKGRSARLLLAGPHDPLEGSI